MISQTRYKTIYAIYSLTVSLIILGLHYINNIRLLTGVMGSIDFERAHICNLVQIGIISVIAIIVSSIIMYVKQLHFSPWKFLYGIISATIIFFIEFLMILSTEHISSGDFFFLELLAIVCCPVICIVLAGLIIYSCLLKVKSDVNILFDDDCEVVSAVFISNIAVTIVTVLAYILLCWYLH